ncbi:DUF169 domain-containing protein [bacterium]|nr:DUF169 domain-containing protein [bacterium]
MHNIIGITFRKTKPEGIRRLHSKDKHCYFIGRARKEEAFYICKDDINCPLARFYLGIGSSDLKALAHTLVDWNDAIDESKALDYLRTGVCISKTKEYIIYFSYPQKDINPDIIIKIANPDQMQVIIQKFSSHNGEGINATLSGIGAACGECTAYPYVAAHANLSVGCYGSRLAINLRKEELLLAAPFNSKMAEILTS